MEWLRKSPSLSGGRNSNSGLVVFPQWWHCRRGQLCSRGTTTDLCLVLCAGAQPSDITGVMFPAHSLCDSQGPAGPGLPPTWPLPPLSPHVHCQQPKLTVTHSLTWILSRPERLAFGPLSHHDLEKNSAYRPSFRKSPDPDPAAPQPPSYPYSSSLHSHFHHIDALHRADRDISRGMMSSTKN